VNFDSSLDVEKKILCKSDKTLEQTRQES